MRIPVLYHDEDIVVINKPAGIPTHAANPSDPYPGDAVRAAQRQLGLGYLGMHQRLDTETSGVLLFAARPEANLALAAAFAGRSAVKVYLALVRGVPEQGQGTINAPIAREHGETYRVARANERGARVAITHYRVLEQDRIGRFSLLEVRPESGRSHQIRVHLAHIGVPVVGDGLYGGRETGVPHRGASRRRQTANGKRHAWPKGELSENVGRPTPRALGPARLGLHAWKLELAHPGTGERMAFTAPPPAYFEHVAQGWPELWSRGTAPFASLPFAALRDDIRGDKERRSGGGDRWQWEALVELAVERRAPLAADPATSIYRLINGAGDGLPGLTVDRYGDAIVVGLYDQVLEDQALHELVEGVVGASGTLAGYVKQRPREASRVTEEEAAALAPAEPEVGRALGEYVAHEDGLAYLLRPGEGWNPGLFPDMREMRGRVRAWAGGKRVLNCFAYTCGFGVAATAGGAQRVLNLDLSKAVLERGQANYRANSFVVDPHDFVYGDAFDWLRRLAKRGDAFDMVILDPPGFARTKTRRFSAAQDYGELAALALKVTAPQGVLIAACNVAELPWRPYRDRVLGGLAETGRIVEVMGVYHAPHLDYPIEADKESYLKVLVVRVA